MYYQFLTCLPSGPLKLRASVLSQLNKYTLKKSKQVCRCMQYVHRSSKEVQSANRSPLGTHVNRTSTQVCKQAHIHMHACTAHTYKQPHSLDRNKSRSRTHVIWMHIHIQGTFTCVMYIHISTYHMAPPYSIAISIRHTLPISICSCSFKKVCGALSPWKGIIHTYIKTYIRLQYTAL